MLTKDYTVYCDCLDCITNDSDCQGTCEECEGCQEAREAARDREFDEKWSLGYK